MFQLFHKEGKMVKEAADISHGKSAAALIFQALLIMLLSELAASIIISFVLVFSNQDLSMLDGAISDQAQLISLFMTLGPVIGFLIASRYYYKRSYRSLGLQKKHALRQYLLGLGLGLIMMAGAVGLAYISGGLTFDGLQNASFGILILYFIAFMIQGFNEELMMRGFFMNAYAARKGMMKAILLNSVLFALLHLGNDGISVLAMLNLILAGISFSLMAAYFDNIIVCSAAHTMWNFAQGNIFGVLVSGIYLPTSVLSFKNNSGWGLLNGGAFGLEGGFAVTVVELACIVLLCYLYQRKKKKQDTNEILSK